MRVLEVYWSQALSLVCEVALKYPAHVTNYLELKYDIINTPYIQRPYPGPALCQSRSIRATSHTRLRARDRPLQFTLIGGEGRTGSSSLEGPTEYVTARWM